MNRRCNRWNNYRCNGGNCETCLWPHAGDILAILAVGLALLAGMIIGVNL